MRYNKDYFTVFMYIGVRQGALHNSFGEISISDVEQTESHPSTSLKQIVLQFVHEQNMLISKIKA